MLSWSRGLQKFVNSEHTADHASIPYLRQVANAVSDISTQTTMLKALQVRSWGGWRLATYVRTVLTSQMFLYFDKEGFNSNTPLRKQHTMGWAPKGGIVRQRSNGWYSAPWSVDSTESYARIIHLRRKNWSHPLPRDKWDQCPLNCSSASIWSKVGSSILPSSA